MTTADIDAGRIIVRPSFADLFVCRQIPGSRWDAARKAWSLPATVATATLLRKKLRSVSESDRFRLFLTTNVTITPDAERTTALLAGAVVPGNVVPLVPPVPLAPEPLSAIRASSYPRMKACTPWSRRITRSRISKRTCPSRCACASTSP